MRGPRLGCLTIILAVTAFLALVITGVMTGSVFQAVLTPAAQAAPATAASQCEPLPAITATASPSPSPTAAPAQLCISVKAAQDSVKAGQATTWAITVTAQGGSVPAVTVTLSTTPAGAGAAFTGTCPSGSGTASCYLGDMATPLTPSIYVLLAQATVPASTTASTITLTASASASAATTPAMTTWPAAGQAITITAAKATPTPDPARSTPATAPTQPAAVPTRPATAPVAAEPTLAPIPTYAISTSVASAGNIASVLPVITAPATSPAAPGPVDSVSPAGSVIPAANIQDVPAPASSTPQAGTFTLTIGMSAQTAETLGIVILALIVVLAATRIIATQLTRSRPETTPGTRRHVMKIPRIRIRRPRPRRRQRMTRAERRAAREANWRRHLEGERKALPPPPPAP